MTTIWLILLTVFVLVSFALYIHTAIRQHKHRGDGADDSADEGESVPWRKNVLVILVLAYASLARIHRRDAVTPMW